MTDNEATLYIIASSLLLATITNFLMEELPYSTEAQNLVAAVDFLLDATE